MRDETFSYFISKFGEATRTRPVPAATLKAYRDRLPHLLLRYWETEGWGEYCGGLLRLVNPDEYAAIVAAWLEGTPFATLDRYHAVACTAFGTLSLCGETTGLTTTITASHAFITSRSSKPLDAKGLDQSVDTFFVTNSREDCDLNDESGQPLFERAVQKLGPLRPGEIYGFEPALVAGGRCVLENLARVRADVHLLLLRELNGPARVPWMDIDLDKLLPKE